MTPVHSGKLTARWLKNGGPDSVDVLPIENGDIPASYVRTYQRIVGISGRSFNITVLSTLTNQAGDTSICGVEWKMVMENPSSNTMSNTFSIPYHHHNLPWHILG